MTNVLRRSQCESNDDSVVVAARVEFLDIAEKALRIGKPLNMADLEALYIDVLHENDVAIPSCCRKTLKQLISSQIPDVEFHSPERVNEPERVFGRKSSVTREAAQVRKRKKGLWRFSLLCHLVQVTGLHAATVLAMQPGTERATKRPPIQGSQKEPKRNLKVKMAPLAPREKNWEETKKLTRSQTCPYNKKVCFFCERVATHQEHLHSVSTTSAGQSIRSAVQILGDAKLQTKLATAIDSNDAYVIDIKYQELLLEYDECVAPIAVWI